jgi:pyruvate/2-oxoglutarate dehydrogenase complex dihydrolipoamide acyltransferase (E2) component
MVSDDSSLFLNNLHQIFKQSVQDACNVTNNDRGEYRLLENTRRFICQRYQGLTGPGQSFSAGDVLLEIETDKAQMDVEAQDDGVLAKIVIPDGSKNVKVGKTIAMLAEQGDDLSTVEVPKEDDAPEADGEAKTNQNQKSSSDSASKSAGEKDHILGSYPPAVLRLLQQFRIEDPSVIRPTGPQGRILKGDVLAYAGKIGKQVPQVLNEILIKKQKLDLTNIQIQKPQRAPVASPSVHRPKAPPEPSKLMAVVRVRQLLKVQRKLSGSAA